MSSLRVASCLEAELEQDVVTEDWVRVTSPIASQPQPKAPGVVLALAAARERYRAGRESELVIETIPEFGSGDADLARAIGEDLEGRWDR